MKAMMAVWSFVAWLKLDTLQHRLVHRLMLHGWNGQHHLMRCAAILKHGLQRTLH
jgi:hypothetical protein